MTNLLLALRSIVTAPLRQTTHVKEVRHNLSSRKKTRRIIEIRHRHTRQLLARIAAGSLGGLNLQEQNLEGANLEGAWMLATCLRRANLRGANLRRATLFQADLEGADLEDAELVETDLSRASLQHANLRGADLRGADLTGAELNNAWYNDCTRWPAGLDPQSRGATRTRRDGPCHQSVASDTASTNRVTACIRHLLRKLASLCHPSRAPRAFQA